MNKQGILYLILFANIVQTGTSFSMHGNHYRTLDPMIDFAVPQSLTEHLHEGLIAVETLLASSFDQIDEAGSLLTEISSQLTALNNSYDTMIGKSNINKVYSDDREFLQKMIDRIDSMIHELEKSVKLSEQDESVLQENIELVGQLRSKMGV